ncbi:siderophore ferric iron reductase [Vibrio metoecus]|uniref:siderophore ferric iron reductase n=1 Tax=Vibrio metoecus TaxID=1481663 RepID=UPI000BA92E87|nr:siderophore ferric iron reductase [Vibrio metoecus]PAR46121.1 siderophore ferric iron reductase [Vibrio metoecus]
MTDPVFFAKLFEHSRQVTPYLNGQWASDSAQADPVIQWDHACSERIQTLYRNLQEAHPEAGAAYWLTRTWTLLCWQPIYVAFVAIYACRGLPQLSSIAQNVQTTFVSGFHFNSLKYHEGSERDLIIQAGKELVELFEYFRLEMEDWTRIRPGFTHHLFADSVLGCLTRFQAFYPHLSEQELLAQAHLWLEACGLPTKLAQSLSYSPETQTLSHVRTSCCLVYKCQGRKLCRDCPRHPDNKN